MRRYARALSGGSVGQYSWLKGAAQRLLISFKARTRAQAVAFKTVCSDRKLFISEASLDALKLRGLNVQASGIRQRQARLRQDGRDHCRLQHQVKREITGKTHADRTNARTAATLMHHRGERP